MSEAENKTENKKDDSAPEKGPRGEVGEPTAGLTLKQRWHQTHFILENNADKAHPYRRQWVPQKGAISLKAFARQLAKEGDELAIHWLDSKKGKFAQKRSEANVSMAKLCASATKVAKRKKKGEGGGGK